MRPMKKNPSKTGLFREPATPPSLAMASRQSHYRAVAIWLWSLAALVFLMVIVGGATRLTESGLSITEWKPLTGIIPPLSPAQWLAEFENYKRIPQYARALSETWI